MHESRLKLLSSARLKGIFQQTNERMCMHVMMKMKIKITFLSGLLRYCESRCSHLVDLDNIVSYYIHAKVYNATQLLAYCEGFLLQNMVALLTYDDSVKRLLFGKKLQNHDVLFGLLANLQLRIRAKK